MVNSNFRSRVKATASFALYRKTSKEGRDSESREREGVATKYGWFYQ